MTIRTGTWGFSKWGTLKWGRSMFGVPCVGQIVSDRLIESINQTTPTANQISATVTIDGVDASSLLTALSVKTTALGGARIAEITFGSGSVPGLVARKSVIEISAAYVIGSDSFASLLFKGKSRIVKPTKSGSQAATTVTCFDMSRVLDDNAPINATFSGSAHALIRQELLALGIEFVEFNQDDYTLSGLNVVQYPTVRALVNAVASGRGKAYTSYDPDGIFRGYDTTKDQAQTWAIPLTGQVVQAQKEQTSGVYNRVTASNGAGLTQTYNDTDHQADNGILETSITCPLCTLNTQLLAYATQYAKESQAKTYEIETPMNPFIQPGNRVGIETESGEGITARVEEATITFSWPSGARHRLTCREVPDLIETQIVASPTTEIFSNKGYGWGGLNTISNWGAASITPYLPEFTVTREWAVRFIALQHAVGSTAGTVTLINTDTLDEIGPITLTETTTPWDGYWHTYYVEPGFSLPAGTYRLECSTPESWLVFGDYSGPSPKGAILRIGGD